MVVCSLRCSDILLSRDSQIRSFLRHFLRFLAYNFFTGPTTKKVEPSVFGEFFKAHLLISPMSWDSSKIGLPDVLQLHTLDGTSGSEGGKQRSRKSHSSYKPWSACGPGLI